jgi:hypothetical protein
LRAAYWAPVVLTRKTTWDSRLASAEKTFELVQWAHLSDTTSALSQMSLRASAKNEQLAARVRENQDLSAEWRLADTRRSETLSKNGETDPLSLTAEQHLADIEGKITESNGWLRTNFPQYAELSRPRAVSAKDTHALLQENEALVVFSLTPWDCFVWVITTDNTQWVRLEIEHQLLVQMVTAVRQQLVGGRFNLNLAYGVYRAIFGPIEKELAGKDLLIVPDGILTSLPLHLLVTEKPEATDEDVSDRYRHASWMIKNHAMTTLPSVSALEALRKRSASSDAAQPYLGIGNPLLGGRNGDDLRAWKFKRCSDLTQASPIILAGGPSPASGLTLFRGGTADVSEIRRLEPLPETAVELCDVAESFRQGVDAVIMGSDASEATVRRLSRDHILSTARVTSSHAAGARQQY